MLFWAIWMALMFGAALNSKALGASLVAAIALQGVYPDENMAMGILVLYVGALLAAEFRG